MICDTCAVEMSATTTELEIPVKKRLVKALNVPASVCPTCGRVTVEKVVEKVARKAAKRCSDDDFDFSQGIVVYGFAPGLKAKGDATLAKLAETVERLEE